MLEDKTVHRDKVDKNLACELKNTAYSPLEQTPEMDLIHAAVRLDGLRKLLKP